jgi:hypothetical protein
MTSSAAVRAPSPVHAPFAGSIVRLLRAGAPLASLLGGMSAEWLDFRALRVPLLLMVGLGVLATSYAMTRGRTGTRPFWHAVLIGAATWAAVETVYEIIHMASGEHFHAGLFGPQWSQAIGLIAAHGLFIGVPTGIAAALMLHAPMLRRRVRPGG